MRLGANKFLGLAFGERTVRAAEVRVSGGRRDVVRYAELALPDAWGDQPTASAGNALSQFLRKNHFSASAAVIGVPARWLIAREREIPPATPEVAASALRLDAERQFSLEINDLVFDYAGQPSPTLPKRVLLVALLKQRLDLLTQLAGEAGLSVIGVTSSTLNLSAAAGAPHASVVIQADSSELVAHADGAPRLLKHMASASPQSVAGEIGRTLSLLPQNGVSNDVVLWGGSPDVAASIQQMGLAPRISRDFSPLGLQSAAVDARFADAAALAATGDRPQLRPIDFLRSRLATGKPRLFTRRVAWGTAIAAALAIGFVAFMLDIRSRQARLDKLKADVTLMAAPVKDAEAIAQRVSAARPWYDGRTPILPCMLAITEAFPEEGRVWATNITIKDNGRASVSGKADAKASVHAVRDRLVARKGFTDVRLDLREATGAAREVTFQINFLYTAPEGQR